MVLVLPTKEELAACPSGIYCIRHTVEGGKVYVGSAVLLKRRIKRHLVELKAGRSHNLHLQRAFDTHGTECFSLGILEYVQLPLALIPREQYWIDLLNSANEDFGYNILAYAGSNLGMRHTEAARAKISAAHKGKLFSVETRAKIGDAQRGKTISLDHRARCSAAIKGKKKTPEQIEKAASARRGRYKPVYTLEWKAAISAAGKGRPKSVSTKAAMSAFQKGRPKSASHIEGMCLGWIKRRERAAAKTALIPPSHIVIVNVLDGDVP